ncbi:hypothetical protein B0I00_1910 [Novosphingobium kunmingense]|uniref:Uncharacterized protein n=1 Tax=Novosphingobium kunmingense TaxID=1211806 RepID=A0A2N0HL70_9SPHN|nr:hypothetical protein [Novosphingobium kunmingense]PKB19670.1 hypothetical protein B0I00_1910 [Novosphingobium kunmingense]
MTRWLHVFALVCVAVTSAFLIWLSLHLIEILAARDWCLTAIGADKASPSTGDIDTLTACVGLLTLQVRALAIDSHIAIGTLALCLAVLVVVVLANARIQLRAGPSGVDGTIGGAGEGARATAEAAGKKADEIAQAEENAQTGPKSPEAG